MLIKDLFYKNIGFHPIFEVVSCQSARRRKPEKVV